MLAEKNVPGKLRLRPQTITIFLPRFNENTLEKFTCFKCGVEKHEQTGFIGMIPLALKLHVGMRNYIVYCLTCTTRSGEGPAGLFIDYVKSLNHINFAVVEAEEE